MDSSAGSSWVGSARSYPEPRSHRMSTSTLSPGPLSGRSWVSSAGSSRSTTRLSSPKFDQEVFRSLLEADADEEQRAEEQIRFIEQQQVLIGELRDQVRKCKDSECEVKELSERIKEMGRSLEKRRSEKSQMYGEDVALSLQHQLKTQRAECSRLGTNPRDRLIKQLEQISAETEEIEKKIEQTGGSVTDQDRRTAEIEELKRQTAQADSSNADLMRKIYQVRDMREAEEEATRAGEAEIIELELELARLQEGQRDRCTMDSSASEG